MCLAKRAAFDVGASVPLVLPRPSTGIHRHVIVGPFLYDFSRERASWPQRTPRKNAKNSAKNAKGSWDDGDASPSATAASAFAHCPRAKGGFAACIIDGVDPVTAFVLAGGKSSRMGPNKDKAFLKMGGRTLLEHALELARAAAGSAPGNRWIVGSADKFAAFGPVVEDIYPGNGPLAGIHAALTASATDLNLIIAVDMPFLQPGFLNYLIRQARASTAAVVVPRTATGLQPLAAVYRREFAAAAERSLRAGENKVTRLFPEFHTRVIEPEELKENGFAEDLFSNLNTEQEWLKAQPKLIAR